MAHDHAHAHAPPADRSNAFLIGILLNVGIVVAEVAYGVISNSMALIADAGHNLSDVLGLVLAWGAIQLGKRRATKRRTYGLRSTSILAALANALLLVFATGAVVWESIGRLRTPEPVHGRTIMAVAGAAVVVNGISALLFMKGRESDLNVRSAFLHLAGDAAIALGVVVSGGIIVLTGWSTLDPLVSIGVSALILLGTWSLLRGSLDLALDAVPHGIDPDRVRRYLGALPGVTEVHDLHIWGLSTTETALTTHLVMEGPAPDGRFLQEVAERLEHDFKIQHATVQLDLPSSAAQPCETCSEPPPAPG